MLEFSKKTVTVLTKTLILQLFHDHRAGVVAFLTSRVRCIHTAEDLAQEVYSRLLKLEGRAELRDCKAFLYRIAANLAADHYDHQQVRARTYDAEADAESVPDSVPSLETALDTERQLELVWMTLETLPERCRHAFLLSRFDALSHPEIAARLGVSVSTVERDISRAMALCHTILGMGGVD